MKKVTSLFFLLVTFICFSQKPLTSPIVFGTKNQLFTVVKNPSLNKEQQFRYNKILDRDEHDYIEVVQMDYLPKYIHPKSKLIKLKVPALRHVKFPKLRSKQQNIALKTVRNETKVGSFKGFKNFVFYGNANPTISINTGGISFPGNGNGGPQTDDYDPACRYADMTVIQSSHGNYGMININDKSYQIFNLKDNLYALAQVKDAIVKTELTCALDGSKSTKENNSLNAKSIGLDEETIQNIQKSPSCVIDIGILYTPEALTAFPDIEDRADIANENANNALINSDIPDVSFNIVGYRQHINPLLGGTSMGTDLPLYASSIDATCFRDEVGADIVILLTGNTYGDVITGMGGFGIAYIGPDEPDGYGMVQSDAMLEIRHSYAHEIGHTLGCAHQVSSNPLYEPYARAMLFNATPTCGPTDFVGTVVTSGGGGWDYRILHYSNPDVNFWSSATGTVNNDNARRIEETALQVSGFRNSASAPAYTNINSWPNTTCPCDYTFYYGASDIDTYEWTLYEELSPGVYTQVFTSNNASFILGDYAGCSPSTTYQVELIVTYNSGNCSNYIGPIFHSTGTIPPGPCQSLKNDGDEESTGIVDYQESLTVYPNPSTDVVNVVLPEDLLEKNVELRLNNLSGQQMASIQIHDLQTLNQQLSFNQYNLANGIYILEVESDGKLMVEKVSVIR